MAEVEVYFVVGRLLMFDQTAGVGSTNETGFDTRRRNSLCASFLSDSELKDLGEFICHGE